MIDGIRIVMHNPTQLQPEDDRDRKDAERYRFLRAIDTTDLACAVSDATGVWCSTEDEIDAAIDAAMKRPTSFDVHYGVTNAEQDT